MPVPARPARTPAPLRRPAWLGLWAALLCSLTGCETARFYHQAVTGQLEINWERRPIDDVLADPVEPVELKNQLRLIRRLVEFAGRELNLPTNGHYRTYADLQRPFVVWNVFAAPEFSVEPKSWWYPIVGRQEYRGYFRREDAQRLARDLRAGGYDVHVGGVRAYSTLGWFHDPVLNTWVWHDEADLADLVFHELTHHRLFIADDTPFNEALATAVAAEGVSRWFRLQGRTNELARYHQAIANENEFVDRVLATREELERLYASGGGGGGGTDPVDLRRAKAAVLDRLREECRRLEAATPGLVLSSWQRHPVNNARLNTISAYHSLVPGFNRLLAERNGNLEEFFRVTGELGKLPPGERRRRLGVTDDVP